MNMARPRRKSDKQLIDDVDKYLKEVEENDEIPQVIRFARRNGMTKQALYYRAQMSQELLDSIKRIVEEKELILEEGALKGKYQPSVAIFSLKQLGWRDKPEVKSEEEDEGTGVVMIAPIMEKRD